MLKLPTCVETVSWSEYVMTRISSGGSFRYKRVTNVTKQSSNAASYRVPGATVHKKDAQNHELLF